MTNYFLSIQQYWEPPGVKVWPLDVEHGLGNQAAVQRSVQEPVPALDSRVGGDTINSIFTVPVSSYNSSNIPGQGGVCSLTLIGWRLYTF